MKLRRVVTLFAVFVVICLVAPAHSLASQVRIVRLSLVEGKVHVERPGTEQENAVLNMPVVQGTRVSAENDSAVEIEFENGSTLRMVGPAVATFSELSLRDEGDKVTLVELGAGTYYFDINHKGDDDFRVTSAYHELRLRKSSHFRIVDESEVAKIAVFKGELEIDGRGNWVTVKKNETLTLDAMDSRFFLAKGIDTDPNDQWDTEREQYRESYAEAESYKYANVQYGGPYSYGFTDLNYYGRFFSVPGYGWMWRPAYFDASWNPFDNGAWVFYPGQGWMFVSMYPWGWTPYRYGQWIFVPAHGWCWRPTHSYRYWNVRPVVHNPPRGWYRPTPPRGSVWERSVLVNPQPKREPSPGAWHRPAPRPTGPAPGLKPPSPADPVSRTGVRHPTDDGKVVVRQPEAPGPRRTVKTDPKWAVDKINNDVGPTGSWKRVDPDQPKRDARPQAQPKPVAPTPQPPPQAMPPVKITPVERTPEPMDRGPSPKVDSPRFTPSPRMDTPRPSAPPPQHVDTPRSAPPPRMDSRPPRMDAPRTAPTPRMDNGGAGRGNAVEMSPGRKGK